MATYGNQLDRF